MNLLPRSLLLLFACGTFALAAEEQATPFEKWIDDYGIIVRKGLENKNFAKDPAAISWTSPEGGNSSTTIDIGIGVQTWESSADPDAPWNLMPKVEYHKNTETESKQDTFKAGATFTKLFGAEKPLTHFFELSATYKNDRIKAGQGISGSLSYTPTYAPLHLGYTGTGDFAFMLTPWVALQAEQADNLDADAPAGSVTRLKASLEVALYPFNKQLKKNVEVLISHQVWFNQSRSGPFAAYKKRQELFSASLNVYLDKDQRFGIGLDYHDGQNPEEGQDDETVTSLSFKVKLGK